ncbi:hypothetical protein [Cupriavidus sp. IDO]|uniref:hypothetical protein n=1 Tax=Cupriavidus sp. IDO TaxID=1539142 RepID=UPI000AE98369|nr:hypothetical protein [Cupriavidus sp. IDO]
MPKETMLVTGAAGSVGSTARAAIAMLPTDFAAMTLRWRRSLRADQPYRWA